MFTFEELQDISDCVSYTLCSPFVTCDEEEERLLKLFDKVKTLILTELKIH